MKTLILIGVISIGALGQSRPTYAQDTNAPTITGLGVYTTVTTSNADGTFQDAPGQLVSGWGDLAPATSAAAKSAQDAKVRNALHATMQLAQATPPPTTTTLPGTPPVPVGLPGIGDTVSNIVSQINETNLLFTTGEIEFRLGGVYSQQTGEAGALLAVEKWDVLTPNLGFGAESVQSGTKQAAEFAYVGYRKILGNTAGNLFVGAGYDELTKEALGVVGARLEYRQNKHLGAWTSVSYGLEPNAKNSRGLLVGAGVSYAF